MFSMGRDMIPGPVSDMATTPWFVYANTWLFITAHDSGAVNIVPVSNVVTVNGNVVPVSWNNPSCFNTMTLFLRGRQRSHSKFGLPTFMVFAKGTASGCWNLEQKPISFPPPANDMEPTDMSCAVPVVKPVVFATTR